MNTYMNPLAEMKDEVTAYFEALGYETSWDFSARFGKRWYEICDDDGLVAQIDMDVELKRIVADLTHWATSNNKNGVSQGPDYEVNGDGPAFKRLCRQVAKKGLV